LSIRPVLQTFLNKESGSSESNYVLFGAPLDSTTSNRRGTRFGPTAIRRESIYLDTLSVRSGLDWGDMDLLDAGDVECSNVEISLKNIQEFVCNIKSLPVMLGGEHTISLGSLRALQPDLVIVYDAHLDARDELFGDKTCHATYLRRGIEELGFKTLVIGARALSSEEVTWASRKENISYITAQDVFRRPRRVKKAITDAIDEAKKMYLSIDMDVLDPAFAPAVGNPHPEGLSTKQLMDLICTTTSEKLVGIDLTEVYPHYDTGITATTAAYILMETIYCHIEILKI
jgi:agmatinase